MDFLRNQVLKNAYGNDDTFIAKRDPRILLVWYVFFALAPWFVGRPALSAGLLRPCGSYHSHGKGGAPWCWSCSVWEYFPRPAICFVVSLLFGGNAQTVVPLLVLTLKVATVSLASITVFSGLDPDRLSNGLMWYRMSGAAVLFHLLRLPDAAHADGGIPECAAVLPAAGKSRRTHDTLDGKGAVSDLPDTR